MRSAKVADSLRSRPQKLALETAHLNGYANGASHREISALPRTETNVNELSARRAVRTRTIEVRGAPMRHRAASVRELFRQRSSPIATTHLQRRTHRIATHIKTSPHASWLAEQVSFRATGSASRCAITEWMLIYWACVSMGVAVVGMNAWWVMEDLNMPSATPPSGRFPHQKRLTRILQRRDLPTA
jgi:long-chain acyl-CoA synthetase